MRNIYLVAGLILFSCSNKEVDTAEIDTAEIVSKIVLPKIINETSGLEFYNNNFITHNDSGGEPSLYLFNEEGEIIETIGLDKNPDFKIENNDWEDITSDNKYFFVADTGNNFGNRDNLNIIRLSKGADLMVDGIIEISYSDQESFFPRPKHKYDAEAIIVIEDKIALFSKDRENLNTDLYLVDKNSGNIMRTNDLYKDYKDKKRKQIKPTGFFIAANKIYVTNSDGKLIIVNSNEGNILNIVKISGGKILQPFINENNLFLISNGSVIKFN